ncbi:hypothetical protein D3C85_750540 [compost metagenome]
MGGVDNQHVDTGGNQLFHALFGAGAHADRRANAQLALGILAGHRVFGVLDDVLDGGQATQFKAVVHDQHAFQTVLVHQGLRFVERGAFLHGDQAFLRRHDVAQGLIQVFFEAQVAVGHDANQLAAFDDRQARDAMLALQRNGVAHFHLGGDGDRIDHDAEFVALDASHFTRLGVGGHVLVNDPDSALLCHGDGQARFGDGVHGGGHKGDIQADIASQARGQGGVARQHLGIRRHQQHIVEGERFLNETHG